jgi:hypothetical protein
MIASAMMQRVIVLASTKITLGALSSASSIISFLTDQSKNLLHIVLQSPIQRNNEAKKQGYIPGASQSAMSASYLQFTSSGCSTRPNPIHILSTHICLLRTPVKNQKNNGVVNADFAADFLTKLVLLADVSAWDEAHQLHHK